MVVRTYTDGWMPHKVTQSCNRVSGWVISASPARNAGIDGVMSCVWKISKSVIYPTSAKNRHYGAALDYDGPSA